MKTLMLGGAAALLAFAMYSSTADANMIGGTSMAPRIGGNMGGGVRFNPTTLGSPRTFSPDGKTFSPDGKTKRGAVHYRKKQDDDPPPDPEPDPKRGNTGTGGGTKTGSNDGPNHYPAPHRPHYPYYGPHGPGSHDCYYKPC